MTNQKIENPFETEYGQLMCFSKDKKLMPVVGEYWVLKNLDKINEYAKGKHD